MKKRLATILAVATSVTLAAPAHTATAAATPIVYVDADSAVWGSWNWALKSAVGTVDGYTGSRMAFGRCRYGYRCIHIRQQVKNPAWAAVTYVTSPYTSWIFLNPNSLRQPYWWEKRLIRHELGHAFWLGHAPRCDSVMNMNIACWWTFNSSEARFLRSR